MQYPQDLSRASSRLKFENKEASEIQTVNSSTTELKKQRNENVSSVSFENEHTRKGVIVANTGATTLKSPDSAADFSSNSESTSEQKNVTKTSQNKNNFHVPLSYNPVTVPIHLSPQLPNAEASAPMVQPGGMLSFLYSGLPAPPSLPLPQTAAGTPYIYSPLSQAVKSSVNSSSPLRGSQNRPDNPASVKEELAPYYSVPHYPHHNNPNQLAHLSTQRHYLGYPQAILTPSRHPIVWSSTPKGTDLPKEVNPSNNMEKHKSEDDDYDT